MLKKAAAVIVAASILVLALCACSGWRDSYEEFLDKLVGKVDVEQSLRNTNAEEDIRTRLEEYTKDQGKILWFNCDDFDGDGSLEAFSFVGKAGAQYLEGILWFVSESYAVELKESGKWETPEIIEADNTNFMFVENFDDGLTYVFGVENSKVYETAVSGTFSHLTYVGGKDFTAQFTSYDYYEDDEKAANEEPSTKTYWFYLDGGEFYEYGADNSLRRADLRKYPLGSEVVDEIYNNGLTEGLIKKYYPNADEETLDYIAEEAGYFQSIMLRENGIINLNFYGAYDDCFYITFKINGNDVDVIDEGRGFYLPAAVESIATYPVRSSE